MTIRIAFLTGLSNPKSTELSQIQKDFLKSIPIDEKWKCYQNFPYNRGTGEYKKSNIIKASINNARQYFLSQRPTVSKENKNLFLTEYANIENIILLVGSCGLEIFNNMNLPDSTLEKISIFAYGPVARQSPNCKNKFMLCGHKDWISKLWKLKHNQMISSDHLNYLSLPETRLLFIDFLKATLPTKYCKKLYEQKE